MNTIPRLHLGCFPTPIHDLPTLSHELGIEVKVKRDDLTGLGAGGNKIRKLEYLIADARKHGCTILITAGALQSNHVLQTAAAGRRSGMRVLAVMDGAEPETYSGNLLLNKILGVELEFFETKHFVEDVRDYMLQRQSQLAQAGEKSYIVPVGGSNALGSQGYVNCAREMAEQYQAVGEAPPDYLVVAGGSGGTYAGLAVGCAHFWPHTKLIGIVITTNYFAQREYMAKLTSETADLAGIDQIGLVDRLNLDYSYIGAGYGIPSPSGNAAVSEMASKEGIFLDPTYTGKVMSGLIGHVKKGLIPSGSRVLFVHTGGATALLA
ncbi:TPA: D-cysteine desulfhydrase family protein [Klebsiella quasipneumoniae subsp. quasipneumoniae]|nr:D-cysteine desulfhydrase family protein [Klebsiella quasipneumoniae subsp. quasipneumoniae]HCI4651132.1 D-cysteine desulfhydrase family protein [Klebsiella quasipneumoniae subsp. quasipneumoniae]HCI6694403.1 D-cysteine desulfhydrase family protein [Klebsiella quasipneumoniae subsp. quasipneumoniae]HCJ7666375.1 D-cysteine desulfhydrase family protein [Enterobacter hormaechei subsp. xiangfangensis]HCM8069538.1 D-cysteine desulfhydrase family protein [Klebsiella variicola]